jgi:hypothetical protein
MLSRSTGPFDGFATHRAVQEMRHQVLRDRGQLAIA